MHEVLRKLLIDQYEASLCMLSRCAEQCPDELWNAPVARFPFSQVLFHTLIFTDLYLRGDEDSFRLQPFHLANEALFGDYEQLQDVEPQTVYTREEIALYLNFCRQKVTDVLASAGEAELVAPAGFARRNFTRAELHVYNIRHIQHHAAQLILRLRLDSNVDIDWVGSGWMG